MAWKDQIAGSFGFGTASFAAYRPDQEFAEQAIDEAKAEGATREEFGRELAAFRRRYIKSEQVLRECISADSVKLDKLWKAPRRTPVAIVAETPVPNAAE
jgi:hypothetical protein